MLTSALSPRASVAESATTVPPTASLRGTDDLTGPNSTAPLPCLPSPMSAYSHHSHSSASEPVEGELDMAEPGGCGGEPGAEEWTEGPGAASASPHQPQHQQQLAHNMQQMHIAQQQQQQYSQHVPSSASASAASASAASSSSRAPRPGSVGLQDFLLTPALNSLLARFLATRDLFFLQFLNRSCFTLLNSNAQLLREYYCFARLDSFIPFMVDDAFLAAFLTPTYLALADGSTAVRNTYSMHIRHLHLNFCTRISNKSMASIATHIGPRLLSINLEGGGRSRVNETGMRTLFGACTNLTSVNLNGQCRHCVLARSRKCEHASFAVGPAVLLTVSALFCLLVVLRTHRLLPIEHGRYDRQFDSKLCALAHGAVIEWMRAAE